MIEKKKPAASQNMQVTDRAIANEYLEYLQTVRGMAVRTLEAYRIDLYSFLNYCNNNSINVLTADHYGIQGFVADLSAEKKAPASLNRCLSTVRGFYRWLVRFGKRADNPCGALHNQKLPERLPSLLWEGEMANFVMLPESTGILWPQRDKALLLIMYSAGLRISELSSLRMGSLYNDHEGARILGKGGKERFVFFSREAVEALKEYLPERIQRIRMAGLNAVSPDGTVFISRNGKGLSVSGIRWIISQYAMRSGLQKSIHPHSFRHSFATHLMNSGCDVRIVQELLGHASLSTTQRYTHVNIEGLKSVYGKAHPHSTMSRGRK